MSFHVNCLPGSMDIPMKGSMDNTDRMDHKTRRVNGRSAVILIPARVFVFSIRMS